MTLSSLWNLNGFLIRARLIGLHDRRQVHLVLSLLRLLVKVGGDRGRGGALGGAGFLGSSAGHVWFPRCHTEV